MMISIIDQQTLDIDWFFMNDSFIGFVASGGGRLPDSAAKSIENNKSLTLFFRSLPAISDVIINPDLNKIVTTAIDEMYLSDFVDMAKKGLFSFDKTNPNSFSDSNYHLVATPVDPLRFDQLPFEIKGILEESKYNGEIESSIDINSIS